MSETAWIDRFKRFCEHVFVQYGAGTKIFNPITNSRFWNLTCWILIALGILGWAIALYLLQGQEY
jgi:hypothetical protein